MSSTLGLTELYRACGSPQGTPDEISVWNELANGGSASGSIKIGLFGYDITCIEYMCTSIENKDNANVDGNFIGYCGILEARGIDGLAFGGYWKRPSANTDYYCAGFRNDSANDRIGNTMVCFDGDSTATTYSFYNFY